MTPEGAQILQRGGGGDHDCIGPDFSPLEHEIHLLAPRTHTTHRGVLVKHGPPLESSSRERETRAVRVATVRHGSERLRRSRARLRASRPRA